MTGQTKAIIALSLVILLAATIFLTWFVTKRSLGKIQADQPPTLPTTTTSATTSETKEETPLKAAPSIPLVKGWNLKSIPYTLSPNDAASVFSKLSTTDAYFLDADKQGFESAFSSGTVIPARGFWLRSTSGEVLTLVANSIKQVETTQQVATVLKKGWNLIGNPYPNDIFLNPKVQADNNQLTLTEAIEKNVVSSVYTFSPSAEAYLKLEPGQTLKKYQAFLIKAGGDVKLILSSE